MKLEPGHETEESRCWKSSKSYPEENIQEKNPGVSFNQSIHRTPQDISKTRPTQSLKPTLLELPLLS